MADQVAWLLAGVGLAIALALWLLGLRTPATGVVGLLCVAFAVDAALANRLPFAAAFAVLAAVCGRGALTGGAR